MPSPRSTLAVFALALAFYLYTLSPSLAWGDGVRLQREALTGESFLLAELAARPMAPDPLPFPRLGIAAWDHPLYIVLGYGIAAAGTGLFPASDPLWWVNAISAVSGAWAAALVFIIGRRLSGSTPAAALGAALLAVSHTFWWHAATPEVYTLHAALLLAALHNLLEFLESKRTGRLFRAAAFLGLGLANHYLALLGLAAGLIFSVLERRTLREAGALQAGTLARAAAVFVLAASLIPLQAVRLLRSFTPAELFELATGAAFFSNLPAMPLWESGLRTLGFLAAQFSPLGVGLGALGLVRMGRRRNPADLLLLLAFLAYTAFSVFYRVPDQFAFHLSSFVLFALAIPPGWTGLAARLRPGARQLAAGLLIAQVLAAPAFYAALPGLLRQAGIDEAAFGIPQVGTGIRDGLDYYLNPNRRGDFSAYRFGTETMAALPPESLVLAEWYTDTDEYFIFRYFQVVEGLRPDVEIEGWPETDPFQFDPRAAAELVRASAPGRPVYLASLSEDFYGTSALQAEFCIAPEHGLYRALPPQACPAP